MVRVARKRLADELTIEELRYLLMEKQRAARTKRLEQFRKTGRTVIVAPDPEPATIESLRTGVVTDEPISRRERAASLGKIFFDRLLLLVELAAIAGLVVILFNGVTILRDLNKEVVTALQLPTLTPTPLISAVVLPSGHTPPDASGVVAPNDAEIPEHLRPLVQSMAKVAVPTAGPESARRIQIPAIGVDAPVVLGDDWDQLRRGVGQHVGSPDPGQKGNLVLSAHNDVFGEIFRDLDRLKPGDQVIVFTNLHQYVYVVATSQIVLPTQVDVMAPTQEPVVTLISCYPLLVDNKRIVIKALFQSKS